MQLILDLKKLAKNIVILKFGQISKPAEWPKSFNKT